MKSTEMVYLITKKIPRGRITTYGEISRALGISPRAVGLILKSNPKPIEIPCHRVIKSNGEVGGYNMGVKKKIELLKNEGIKIKNGKVVDFGKRFWRVENIF